MARPKAEPRYGQARTQSASYIFSYPDYFDVGGYCFEGILNEVTYVELDPDWGEYLRVEAMNRYGSVIGDYIYTTDYIDDTLILARIEEIKTGSAVNTLTDESVSFRWDRNQIDFGSPVGSAKIFNISGAQVLISSPTTTIDISHLSQGIYIMSYTVNSTTEQIKFQKK